MSADWRRWRVCRCSSSMTLASNRFVRPADEDLHELMAERYESAATIVTSNLDLTEWDQAFPANKLLASATPLVKQSCRSKWIRSSTAGPERVRSSALTRRVQGDRLGDPVPVADGGQLGEGSTPRYRAECALHSSTHRRHHLRHLAHAAFGAVRIAADRPRRPERGDADDGLPADLHRRAVRRLGRAASWHLSGGSATPSRRSPPPDPRSPCRPRPRGA